MAFMGEVSDIGVADLLYLLALRQQTGRLSVVANGDEVSMFIDKGRMALVTSTNASLRLGRMLIRLDILTNDRLREALRFQETAGDGKALGTILIENGFITEQQLHQCVEEQCIEVLARVIAAVSGIFVFHRDAKVSPKTEMVPLNSDRILLEATRRTDELAALKSILPGESSILMLSPDIDNQADQMADAEIQIASALYGRPASMRELTARVALEEVTLWKTIVSMRSRGWLVASRDDATTPAHRIVQLV
jgi:hypothetical protein